MESFNFGQALELLKAGKLVQRAGWNGKNMFIFMRPADVLNQTFIVNTVKSLPQSLKNYYAANINKGIDAAEKAYIGEGEVLFTAYLCMKAADESIVNGWLASQTDMLATDWQEINF